MREGSASRKYEDIALLAILDALENDLGRVGTRKKLGVNFRTLVNCLESRRVTPRMRKALKQFSNWGPVVDDPVVEVDLAYSLIEDPVEPQALKVEDLEAENRELRETIETQTTHIMDWGRRLALLEEQRQQSGVGGWLQRKRRSKEEEVVTGKFMDPPKPGVVTSEHRLNEERALGPSAPVVAEWREVSWRVATSEDGVERVEANFRRLELEQELIEEFDLTLPPDTEPWDFDARNIQIHRRRSDLVSAKGKLEEGRRGRNSKEG